MQLGCWINKIKAMYYVYIIQDSTGTPLYVGESKSPKWRFYDHTRRPPRNGAGTFYGRTDLSYRIVGCKRTRREAYEMQCAWQKALGLETDREKAAKAALKGRLSQAQKRGPVS